MKIKEYKYFTPNFVAITAMINEANDANWGHNQIKSRYREGEPPTAYKRVVYDRIKSVIGAPSIWFGENRNDDDNVKERADADSGYLMPNFHELRLTVNEMNDTFYTAWQLYSALMGTYEKVGKGVIDYCIDKVGPAAVWNHLAIPVANHASQPYKP